MSILSKEYFMKNNITKHVLEVQISNKKIILNVFFNIKCLELFLAYYKKITHIKNLLQKYLTICTLK